MVGTLLLRGMLVGIVAGILCFAFLKVVGEPQVNRAIAFETHLDEAKAKAKADAEMAKGVSHAEGRTGARTGQQTGAGRHRPIYRRHGV